GNMVEYNSIRNTMLYTADNAGIALRQHNVAQAVKDVGNVIRFNRILDTIGYGTYPHCSHPPKGYGSPFACWGIYLDGSICGVTVYGNIIARSGSGSIYVQFGGGNTIENNIFVETGKDVPQFNNVVMFGYFMHTDKKMEFSQLPNTVQRNVFYYTDKNRKLYCEGLWGHPEWNPKQALFDHNLIWHGELPIEIEMDPKHAYGSLAEWQAASGHDQHSVVADPLFLDLAKDDYRLRPESPAFGVGFKDINRDIAKIGAYASSERASWPLVDLVLEREAPVVFEYRKPPRPIVDGFELAPALSAPARAMVMDEGKASVEITREAAATGSQSLKFADAADLAHDYTPHIVYTLNYPIATLRFSVDIMNSKDAPAAWYMEFRDWRKELFVGPTFRGASDGTFSVGGKFGEEGKALAVIPPGTWFTVGIEFETGPNAPKTYALTLNVAGRAEQVFPDLPFVDVAFENPSWFGICSLSTEATAFFVDNLVLGPMDAEQMRKAMLSPTIRGLPSSPRVSAEMQNAEQLALHWSFDETGGNRIVDHSGNGLDGDLAGGTRARGSFGTALVCDGGETVVELDDDPRIQLGQADFSIACWMCPTMLSIDSAHQRRRFLDKGLWPKTWWNVDILSDGRIRMEMHDSEKQTGTTQSQGAIDENRWTHVAIVVDRRNSTTTYYLNGRRDSVIPLPAEFAGSLDTADKSLTIGNWQPFIGLLGELRIYKRALTGDEVAAQYAKDNKRYTDTAFRSSESLRIPR
ncbi:MAG: hypothetical protein KAI66_10940, partial [Lentisphaeria bacterium]|nr:hypothetical protein [Lentisphaeria bacterium]